MKNIVFYLFIIGSILSGCVSLGKFEELELQRNAVQQSLDSLKNVSYILKSTLERLRNDSTALSTQLQTSTDRITQLTFEVDTLRGRILALENDLDILTNNYEQSKSKNSAEIKKLLSSLEKLQKDIGARETKAREYEQELHLRDSTLASLQTDLFGREQRLRDLEHRLSMRDSALNALKSRLNDALLGFKDIGLTITIVNGRVYVSLSNQLLFTSGKTVIDKRGREALLELAGVLNTQPDLSILIEGHTDNQPVFNLGSIKDNWDLSVLRATEVVRFLTKEGNVDPKRVIASGRSEYYPVNSEESSEARALNRRTEIILIPRLSELFEILGQ